MKVWATLSSVALALLLLGPSGDLLAAGKPPAVTKVRFSTSADHTRIVLDLTAPAKFSRRSEPDPHELVVLLPGVALGNDAKGARVADGAVQQIVLSETAAGLEVHVALASAGECDVFALDAYADKPFRVVIDVPRSTPGSKPAASNAPPGDVPPADAPPAGAPPAAARPPDARPSAASVKTRPVRRVVIDPGHGGEDWGTRGYGGLVEKKLTLDIARRVTRLLNAAGTGCEASLTRDDDTFVGLARRVRLAQTKGADLFVSVHANSSPNPSARGVEIFFVSLSQATDQASQELADKENAAHLIGVDSLASSEDTLASEDLLGILLDMRQSETIGRSSSLAEAIISSYRAGGEVPVRGVKQAGFQVLRSVVVPSVLVEVGFVTNVDEGKRLLRPDYRDQIAEGIASGVMSFLSTDIGMRATR